MPTPGHNPLPKMHTPGTALHQRPTATGLFLSILLINIHFINMRKILFRAKALNYRPAQWVYGALLHYGNGAAVIIDDQLRYIDVDPDTIGQATGIDDIDGNPIFEGDIVVGIRQDRMQISAAVVWNPLEAGFGSIFRLDHSDIYPMVICPRVVGDIYTGHHLLSANPPMPLPGSEEIDPNVDLAPDDLPFTI